jgi:hypothetical protein
MDGVRNMGKKRAITDVWAHRHVKVIVAKHPTVEIVYTAFKPTFV